MADSDDSREKQRAYTRKWQAAHRRKHIDAVGTAKRKNPLKYGYLDHKSRAKKRGITFLLTFEEWKTIWLDSGKWDQRGLAVDSYCMARHGDVGPYAVGNVRICTRRENNAEQAEYLRGQAVNDKQRAALDQGRAVRNAPGRPVSEKQRASVIRAGEIRWARVRAARGE